MYQQWLQVVGLIFDGAGFALIALEWYRGYREMRNKVTLVARNIERAEKIRLQRELKDTIGSVGVAEVGPIYNDDQALAEMALHDETVTSTKQTAELHGSTFSTMVAQPSSAMPEAAAAR